jgi:hypothetical protein
MCENEKRHEMTTLTPHPRTKQVTAFCQAKPTSTKTIHFNVGGQKYQVSKSLLDIYPRTMLSKCFSDAWCSSHESEIFIERDGTLFIYVLKYLRDLKVSIPITVSKSDLLNELIYYGIEDINEEHIYDNESQTFLAAKYFILGGQIMNDTLVQTRNEASELNIKRSCLLVVGECIERYISEGNNKDVLNFVQNETSDSHNDDYFGTVYETQETSIDLCNQYLNKIGLMLCSILRSSRYNFEDLSSPIRARTGSSDFESIANSSFRSSLRYSYETSLKVIHR